MALQLPTSQQPVENPKAVGQSIDIKPYLCQPLIKRFSARRASQALAIGVFKIWHESGRIRAKTADVGFSKTRTEYEGGTASYLSYRSCQASKRMFPCLTQKDR